MIFHSRLSLVIVLHIFLLSLVGCGPKTTDPRAGGLFSYDPNAYEQRLSKREKILQDENDTASKLSEEKGHLNETREQKRAQLEKLQAEFDAFRINLSSLELKLQKTKHSSAVNQAKQTNLKKKLLEIQNKSFEVSPNTDEKAKLLYDLEKQKKALEEEIDLLMKASVQ